MVAERELFDRRVILGPFPITGMATEEGLHPCSEPPEGEACGGWLQASVSVVEYSPLDSDGKQHHTLSVTHCQGACSVDGCNFRARTGIVHGSILENERPIPSEDVEDQSAIISGGEAALKEMQLTRFKKR